MYIPARFAPIVSGALLSAIMVAIVSAFVLATSHGLKPEFPAQWLKSCLTTWPMAFPTVTVVAPLVRRMVAGLTGWHPLVPGHSNPHSVRYGTAVPQLENSRSRSGASTSAQSL